MAVAIVGLYPVSSAGEGPDAVHAALCAAPVEGEKSPRTLDLDISEYTDAKHAYLDPVTRIALACASAAADDAGWNTADGGTGFSFGSAFGCRASLERHRCVLETKGGRFSSPFVFSHAYHNSPNSVVSIDLGLDGYNCCTCGGAAAGAEALGCAFDQISLGRCTRILAGAADAPDAPGIPPGGCFLALQDEEEAGAAAQRIHARLLGWHVGHALPDAVAAAAAAGAGVDIAGVPRIDFSGFHRAGGAAAAVMDVACLCLLEERGWGARERVERAAVVSQGANGASCALILELPSAERD